MPDGESIPGENICSIMLSASISNSFSCLGCSWVYLDSANTSGDSLMFLLFSFCFLGEVGIMPLWRSLWRLLMRAFVL